MSQLSPCELCARFADSRGGYRNQAVETCIVDRQMWRPTPTRPPNTAFITRPVGRLRVPADPRHMFHFADHAREILFAIGRRPGGIDLMRGCRRWHRHTQFGRFFEN